MIYHDTDRLRVAVRHDVTKLIKNDMQKIVDQIETKINNVIENTDASGGIKTTRTDKGINVKGVINVPVDNAPEFVVNIDNSIKGSFKFGKWSDMKVD